MIKIPHIPLVTQPETEEAKAAVGYQWNEVAGTRHHLGGTPQDLSWEDHPICPSCQQRMSFYAQIDSIGEQFDLADCRVIHNFVCFDCLEVKAILSQVLA